MPFLYSVLERFMASSEFSPEQLRQLSLSIVREVLYRIFAIILPLAVAASMVFSWYNVRRELAIIEAFLLLLLVVNVFGVFKTNSRIFSKLAFCLVVMFFLAAPISLGFHEFIFFCLLYPVVFYVLVSRQQALWLNFGWLVLSTAFAVVWLNPIEAICYVVSHLFIWVFIEILFSLLAYNEKELMQLSVRDPLTGAFNRRAMESFLENACMMRDRYSTVASVVMLDIDHFKRINDSYGHKEGDLVLRQITALLDKRLRRTDKLCRYGGEEFVLILSNTDGRQALDLANSIREQIRDAVISSKGRITISCGVAEARPGDSLAEWLHRGDMALYAAKQGGRDRVVLDGDGTEDPGAGAVVRP